MTGTMNSHQSVLGSARKTRPSALEVDSGVSARQSVVPPEDSSLLSKVTFGLLGRHRAEQLKAEKEDISSGPVTVETVQKMRRELPRYITEARDELPSDGSSPSVGAAKKIWRLWEKFTNLAPTPWNTLLKFGTPVAAATTGLVFYQAIVQLGIEGLKVAGSLAAPLGIAAGFLVPAFSADRLLSLGEKFFKSEPITGWKRQALLRPAQGALLIGAAVWAQTMNLNMLTFGVWAAAAVGTAVVATKFIKSAPKTIWAAAAMAIILPWGHLATMRSYDVTVLSAGPDPEVAAWNIGTDLTVKDHWKGLFGVGAQSAPSAKSGMVFINRDVPLYLPPHRSANAFNADFTTLVGKQVRVTTIGGWMKFVSPKLQPTIVKYEVISPPSSPVQILQPAK
jgi:hypothetical protein